MISNTLQTVFEGFIGFIPKFLGALFVLILGIILSKIVYKFVSTLLKKTGVDVIKDKLDKIDFVQNLNVKVLPSEFLANIFYYLILLVFSITAAEILSIDQIKELLSDIVYLLPSFLVAIIVLIIGLLIADILKNIVYTTCKSLGIPAAKIVANGVFFFVFINALLIALKKTSVPTEFLTDNLSIILAGIVFAFSIGYGLASKDMMSNFLASFYSKNKINIGDFLYIDNVSGVVIGINSTSVVLESEGDKEIHIPLSKLSTETFEIKPADR